MTATAFELIQEARMAFEAGDLPRGGAILHRILKEDITQKSAWEVLHQALGRGQSFEDFQRTFAARYYPATAHLLQRSETDPEENGPYRRVSLVPEKPRVEEGAYGKLDFPRIKTGPLPKPRKVAVEAQPERFPVDLPPDPVVEEEKPGLFRRLKAAAQAFLGRWRKKPAEPIGFGTVPGDVYPEESPGRISLKNLPPRPDRPSAPSGSQAADRTMLASLGERSAIRVLIADDIAQTRENIRKLLRFEPGIEVVAVAADGSAAVELAGQHRPDIVLLDINMPGMDGLAALKLIRSSLPDTQVIMLTVQDDPGYLREALQSGARDYLVKPPMIDDLLQTIQQTYEIGKSERERQARLVKSVEESTRLVETGMRGFAVAVYSPKGGVGCTLLASNLAVALHSAETPTVLVDADLQYGHVGLFFNEQGRNSILDLVSRLQALDLGLLEQTALVHQGSGVRLLLSPGRPEQAEQISADQLATLIDQLRGAFSYVVVDTASELDSRTAAALAACDQVLLVTTQDIPAIYNAQKLLNHAGRAGVDPAKIAVVINQFHPRVNISVEQIKGQLKREISAVVPLDMHTAVPSANRGIPFIIEAPANQPIVQALRDLAEFIRLKQAVAVQPAVH